ncbi:agenet domain-containing protein, partial [Tanacetum coccineum]
MLPTDCSADLTEIYNTPEHNEGEIKAIKKMTPEELKVELRSDIELIQVTEPTKREAGVIVSSVDELVDKLKNEAHGYKRKSYTRKSNPSDKQLMIRPCYPSIYHKNTMPSVISEVCVVTNNSWKVEDLGACLCSALSHSTSLVMGLLQLHIEYPLPPAGEGKVDETYEALCKDLRPSLVWSQEEGWILSTVDGRTAGDAQLIFPSQKGTDSEREEANDADKSLVEGETEMQSSEAMDVAICEDVKMDDLESIDSISIIGVQESNAAAAAFDKGTDSEKEEVDDAEAVGDSPLDAYGNGISLDSLVEGETKIQKAMDAAVCKDVKMDDLESIEGNAAATAAAF